MFDRSLVLWISILLKVSGLMMRVDGWCYRSIDDAAAELTRRRWARRKGKGGW